MPFILFFLLLLFLVITMAQGVVMSLEVRNNEEMIKSSVKERIDDGANVGVLFNVLRSRKLMIILRKEEEDDEKDRYRYDLKGEKKQEHSTDHGHDHQTYPDLLDIAGMDYSPAKRKPPIHN
ncbi:uncharacterized protein LOC120257403 [Dioscorea cayenensis subsp. rotundata]|uniref:Uncharacterized protein LOC120257403 n=1 Tax=Dioscorea cayennensis subsp. rotundata TaxID=55577 RepID=A0AB40B243_DIOCR|nr:uncharacterized protein LOC120257403 [Dioscorea cayenensis subsp. rotundata]